MTGESTFLILPLITGAAATGLERPSWVRRRASPGPFEDDPVAVVIKAYARVIDGISAAQRLRVEHVVLEMVGAIGLARHRTWQARGAR